MKTTLTVIIPLLLGLAMFASTAFAQNVCPEGTSWVFNPERNEGFCTDINALMRLKNVRIQEQSSIEGNQTGVLKQPLTVKEIMRSSGAVLDFGIGYALAAALHIRVEAGYHFNVESLNGMSFGVYGELSGLIGWPYAIDAAVVPMMHIHGNSFRVSIGYGFGLFHNFDVDKTMFEMKPELRWDWFFASRFVFGIQISVPLILQKRILAKASDIHISQKDDVHYIKSWAMFGLNFGCKF
ncbi:MAG: hypothetical protein IJU23_03500 [Proteobacteria bacterium]|nr:hypothetical protein [Pseudomonadota bacterium]